MRAVYSNVYTYLWSKICDKGALLFYTPAMTETDTTRVCAMVEMFAHP